MPAGPPQRSSNTRPRKDDGDGPAARRVLRPLVVLLLLAYTGWVFLPNLWASFQVRQAMQDEVFYGPVAESPSNIESRILATARQYGLDIPRRALQVDKDGPRVRISAEFAVPVDFGGGLVWRWHQEVSYEGTRRPPAVR